MEKITPKTTLREALANPMAKDMLEKLFLAFRMPPDSAENGAVGRLKFKALTTLTGGLLDRKTVGKLCDMFNLETDERVTDEGEMVEKWWKEAIIYQIYPRSFCDSNGDGIGDLNGIRQKLDYLQELGVTAIWCSPFYDSPNDDNGYDIRDYQKIMAEFGTMEDFDKLLDEIHARGMKLIVDLVVNHTSDEHRWFVEAQKSKDNPYHDYYIWRDGKDAKTPPNNWESFFKGPAWNYYENLDSWALHIFSKKQMDLNWENEKVRQEIYKMMRWWLDKGIDGFRMDVINFISKTPGLPDANSFLGMLTGYKGAEYFFYGPRLHEYLREMRRESFGNYDVYTVGECGGAGIEMGKMLTADNRKELDTIFNFDFLINQGHTNYDYYTYDLFKVMQEFAKFQTGYTNHCWPTVFFENHDNPRIVSKCDKTGAYRENISKVCALIEMTLRGTPYIYQGQEISMGNGDFDSIDQLNDREALGVYSQLVKKNRSNKDRAFFRVKTGTRDNARTPFHWSDSENAGFTTGEPWLKINKDYRRYNAEDEAKNPDSVLNFYKKAIAVRKENKTLVYGSFKTVYEKEHIYCYERELDGEKFYIELNLSPENRMRTLPVKDMELVLSTMGSRSEFLHPFEGNLYRVKG